MMKAEIASFIIACFKRSLAFKTRTIGEVEALGSKVKKNGKNIHQIW